MSDVLIINGLPYESIKKINLATSQNHDIDNQQFTSILQTDINQHLSLEKDFDSTYQGKESSIYNCHGLTFASRRTGIYKDSEIRKILFEEYEQIKNIQDVIIGDIAVYFDDDDENILHSSIVVQCASKTNDNIINPIKVLSKTRNYKEIVHHFMNSPYKRNIKFYRINHGTANIV